MKEFIEKLIGRLEEVGKLEISMHGGRCNGKTLALGYAKGIENSIAIVNQLAEEYKHCIKSSCSNCETYDNEKHYCPKWCDVIKGTVKEMEENHSGWIPCSERLPEGKESHKVLVTDEDGIMAVCYFLEVTKIFKVCWDGEEFQGVIAWQPLPSPYQPKGE